MQAAAFSVIRVGESVWSTWEPEEGRFELDWLEPVLDGAPARGIDVVLGTPTYALPMWLVRRYPEVAGEDRDGPPDGLGGPAGGGLHAPGVPVPRRARDPRRSSSATATTPPSSASRSTTSRGCTCCTTTGCSSGSSTTCGTRTATSRRLNREWGLVYWSHRLSTWADLWTPDGNVQPQYDLAWRRFQATLTTEFIDWQAERRPRARPRRTSSSPPASPTSARRSRTRSSPPCSTSPAATPTTRCRTALAHPSDRGARRSAGRPTAPGRCSSRATRCSRAAASRSS